MTTEAALTKLSYLLGQGLPIERVKKVGPNLKMELLVRTCETGIPHLPPPPSSHPLLIPHIFSLHTHPTPSHIPSSPHTFSHPLLIPHVFSLHTHPTPSHIPSSSHTFSHPLLTPHLLTSPPHPTPPAHGGEPARRTDCI